jgi:alkyl hydroperoxide reductase subunit D
MAAAIMGMNNIYYRFLHLVEDSEYQTLPARLRMNALGTHGIDKLDFELLSIAVSAVNGCGMCVGSHERKLREGGISRETIQSAVRIASVIHAVAGVLEYHAGVVEYPAAA